MIYSAAIHIYHLPSGTHLYTVEENTPSESAAREQFSKLAEIISSMDKDNHSIVLETTEGYVILTRKFLADSILRLKLFQVEDSVDDDAG